MAGYNPTFTNEELQNEIWKTIPRHENYSVSNLGRVRRDTKGFKTYPGRILKPNLVRKYLQLCLFQNRQRFYPKVHYLVLLAFVGERPQEFEVDHINCIKTDNRLCNLEYVSKETNRQRAMAKNRYPKGEQVKNSVLTEQLVREIRALKAKGLKNTEIASLLHKKTGVIGTVTSGKHWKHVV